MEDFKTINWRILCYFKLNIKWLICIKNRNKTINKLIDWMITKR